MLSLSNQFETTLPTTKETIMKKIFLLFIILCSISADAMEKNNKENDTKEPKILQKIKTLWMAQKTCYDYAKQSKPEKKEEIYKIFNDIYLRSSTRDDFYKNTELPQDLRDAAKTFEASEFFKGPGEGFADFLDLRILFKSDTNLNGDFKTTANMLVARFNFIKMFFDMRFERELGKREAFTTIIKECSSYQQFLNDKREFSQQLHTYYANFGSRDPDFFKTSEEKYDMFRETMLEMISSSYI